MEENGRQGIWDHIAEKMLLKFAESGCPIFRGTTPLSIGKLKSKGHGKLSTHFPDDYSTIETFSRMRMCEECECLQNRSWQTDVLMGQSIVLSEIKAEVPLGMKKPVTSKCSFAKV